MDEKECTVCGGSGRVQEYTDADFNKFRCKATGKVVEAWQWWPGKEWGERCWIESYGPGAWLVGPFTRGQLSYNESDFRRVCEPIHPERKRLQDLCDEINPLPGMPALSDALYQAREAGVVVDVGGQIYVAEREPVAEAQDELSHKGTICVKCEHCRKPGCRPGDYYGCSAGMTKSMDWVRGTEWWADPDGTGFADCKSRNTDGECPYFKPKCPEQPS